MEKEKTTGELIKLARKKAGLTQAELGEKLGITPAAISQFEKPNHCILLIWQVKNQKKLLIKKKTVLQDEWYIDNNILTQGAEGAICQPPDERKEAGAYGYIFGFNPICDYALRRDHSCCLYHTQKIAPSVW